MERPICALNLRPSMEKVMNRLISWIAAIATVAPLILLSASASKAQESRDQLDATIKQYLAAHPDEVGEIVKDYVINHPDVFRDILSDSLKQQPAAIAGTDTNANMKAAADQSSALKDNADTLFRSVHQVTLGNPDGDVTMVEFFDYNCGFCRGALPAMLTLLNDDPKL